MKKNKLIRLKKIKHNAKISEIFCCSCKTDVEVLRNDAKLCSTTCRAHEYLFRKTTGYTKLLINGTEEELKKFYWGYAPVMQPNPLKDDFLKISNSIPSHDMTKSWKEVFEGFLVYYFSNRPKAPFEIYVDKSRFEKGLDFKKRCIPIVPTKSRYVR